MKIGLVSYECRDFDVEFNSKQIEKALLNSEKVDILCFGEAYLQGFGAVTSIYEKDIKVAISKDAKEMEYIKNLSIKYDTAIMIGYIEKEEENLYSSYALIENGKILQNYRRMSKNWMDYENRDDRYKEGEYSEIFLYKGLEMRIALCGDMWIMSENFKTEGVLIWPVYVNFALDEKEALEYAKQAKQSANKSVLINALSNNPKSSGGAFYFKEGKIEKELGLNKEGILVVEI